MSLSVAVSLVVLAVAQPAPSPRPVGPPTAEPVWGPDVVLNLGYGGRFGMGWGEIRPAPDGDLYVFWSRYLGHSLVRVTRAGGVVFDVPGGDATTRQRVTMDSSGGILDVYMWDPHYTSAYDIAYSRVTPTGHFEPNGPYLAHEPTPVSEMWPSATTDPTGGGYIAWFRYRNAANPLANGYFLQRVTTAGTIAPGWSSWGRRMTPYSISGYQAAPALLTDGSGGVYMLAALDSLRLWRVQSDTTMAPGWPNQGLVVTTSAYDGGIEPSDLALVAGPAGHTFAVWVEYGLETSRLAARSFDGEGNMDGPVLGLTPFTNQDQYGFSTIFLRAAQADGQGGMLVQWRRQDANEFAHVLANGTIIGPIPVTAQWYESGVVTMRSDGGFLVFRSEYNVGIWAQRSLADGTPVPDAQLLVAGQENYPVAAYPDGEGGAFVLFSNNHYYATAYVMHLLPGALADPAAGESGAVGASAAGASAVASDRPASGSSLSLAIAQNPARGELRLSLALSGDEASSVELLDVTGRRLLTRALPAGASVREERLALPSGLSAGVYFVRLRQGSKTALQRVAIIQ